jgi:lipase maturation factor 1
MFSGMTWPGLSAIELSSRIERPFQWLVGSARSSYGLSRWVFLRALGAIYLIAFLSLWVQVPGLIGVHGIAPAQEFLNGVRGYYPAVMAFHLVPTVLWLGAGDGALHLTCALGVAGAVLLIANVAPRLCLAIEWVLYLSLVAVGQDFLSFQWDALLLETGLLAVLFAPNTMRPLSQSSSPLPLPLFLLWWLLFRLTFASGFVKLTWDDPTWRNLSALDYHFWTQPLPTWTAWYAHLSPQWLKHVSVIGTYVLELGAPALLFGTRRMRQVACLGVVAMQGLIGVTGNYTFFNLLTIALALLLLDDAIWIRVLPSRLTKRVVPSVPAPAPVESSWRIVTTVAGLLLLTAGTLRFAGTLAPRVSRSALLDGALEWAEPLRSVNGYGLFRVMTTTRLEIEVEGSDDGTVWKAYEFRYKPGDVQRRPGFVEPHQPRLDWQMWFAALSPYDATPWFQAFELRLLEGSPEVLDLLRANPFPAHPPRYVRARLYDYRFTTAAERRSNGGWWVRRLVGDYGPVVARAS